MSMYDNLPCSVCGEPFTPADDVVTCPVCGTPHHRACYNQLGHCVHVQEHGQGFIYQRPQLEQETLPAPSEMPSLGSPNGAAPIEPRKSSCPHCGTEYNPANAFCPACGTRNPQMKSAPAGGQSPLGANPFTPPVNPYEGEKRTIEGIPLEEVSSAVQNNPLRYVDQFLKQEHSKKKTGWNWAAFFFGGYWFLYRKMYKWGTLLLGIQLIGSLLFNTLAAAPMQNFYDLYSSILQNGTMAAGDYESLLLASNQLLPYLAAYLGITLTIRIVFTLFADFLYKRQVISVIKKVDSINLTEILPQNSVETPMGTIPFGAREKKLFLLAKKGGASLWAVLAGYVLLTLIQYLITLLA